jgi:hypothetical protein
MPIAGILSAALAALFPSVENSSCGCFRHYHRPHLLPLCRRQRYDCQPRRRIESIAERRPKQSTWIKGPAPWPLAIMKS